MKKVVIGTGYVGLVAGTCFAELGHKVVCIDQDRDKIDALNKGMIPIYEPSLEELVRKNLVSGHLQFMDDKQAVASADGVIIAVGTPSQADGEADLRAFYKAVEEVATISQDNGAPKYIVIKSTVPVGTANQVKQMLRSIRPDLHFEVISNPEFLREGSAVLDFMNPDRVVIGCSSHTAKEFAERLYRPLDCQDIVFTDNTTAELSKYASNCYLAKRVAFVNEMANAAEQFGADITQVTKIMGLDQRIGGRYLSAGPGYGGSCFPKDVSALLHMAQQNNIEMSILEAVHYSNANRKQHIAEKVLQQLKGIADPIVGVLGLAFKANTDDMRDSPSIDIVKRLLAAGISIKAYDPAANGKAMQLFGDTISLMSDSYEAAFNADVLLIITEWSEFKSLDMLQIKKAMRLPCVIDLRNIYVPEEMQELGFSYISIGRSPIMIGGHHARATGS
ncbi:MAG: UDP-glucose/GDP-mannose dehydrogenase family protein [Proteobacteria bacterium]|nr:UDP-glucose/GDP-mannose dehydrogenase family protein [Pseudomonadota bacterium]